MKWFLKWPLISSNLIIMMIVSINQWIGLRENLQEIPIFDGKNHGFL